MGFEKPQEAQLSASSVDFWMQCAADIWRPVLPIGGNSDDKKRSVHLELIAKPDPNLPDVYQHPPSTKLDGKCGITGVCNMLKLYGIDKEPADIDKSEYRSYGFGLRCDKFAEDMTELSGKKFSSRTVEDGDPLDVLRNYIKERKPVAILYMTDSTCAHWVVVTGIVDKPGGPELQLQSWGAYHKVKWNDIKNNWERGYGGPYPHVVGDEASPILKKAK